MRFWNLQSIESVVSAKPYLILPVSLALRTHRRAVSQQHPRDPRCGRRTCRYCEARFGTALLEVDTTYFPLLSSISAVGELSVEEDFLETTASAPSEAIEYSAIVLEAELATNRLPLDRSTTSDVAAFCARPKGDPEISCKVAPAPIAKTRMPAFASATNRFLDALSVVSASSAESPPCKGAICCRVPSVPVAASNGNASTPPLPSATNNSRLSGVMYASVGLPGSSAGPCGTECSAPVTASI